MIGCVKNFSFKQRVNIFKEVNGKNDTLYDSTKYMNVATTLFEKFTVQEFKERIGLDSAYRVFLGDYRKFIEARHKWAHETDDEFARLLLFRQFQEEPLGQRNS